HFRQQTRKVGDHDADAGTRVVFKYAARPRCGGPDLLEGSSANSRAGDGSLQRRFVRHCADFGEELTLLRSEFIEAGIPGDRRLFDFGTAYAIQDEIG